MLGSNTVNKRTISLNNVGSRGINWPLIILVALLSFSAHASSQNPQQQILMLLKSGEAEKAFELAESSMADWEGEPAFDYALAMAAKATGNIQLALFGFERILNRQPSAYLPRYYLAVTYFDMRQWSAAQSQFQILQQYQIDHQLNDNVTHYLLIIQRQLQQQSSHWKNWIAAGIGSDSNANNGIEEEFINVPWLGDIRLVDQSREINSSYTELQAQLLYVQPISQLRSWYAGINGKTTQYADSLAWDRTYLSLIAGYQLQWQTVEFDLSAFYRPLRLDGDEYLDYSGVVINSAYPLSKKSHIGASLSYAQEQYPSSRSRDKDQYIAAIWFDYKSDQFHHKWVLRVAGEDAREQGREHVGRNLWGATYQAYWQINRDWALLGKVDYLDGEHRAPEPLFLTTRKTELLRMEAQLSYRITQNWMVNMTASHMQHNSNIALYDYERSKVMAAIRYSF
ncbi:surface lipoprotein assembly modifier [Thalassotalea fusca]